MSHFTVELRSQTSWSGPVLKTMRYISKLVIAIVTLPLQHSAI